MASWDLQLHPCNTDLENTSLLILIYNFPRTHSCWPKTNINITLSSLTCAFLMRAVSAIHKHTYTLLRGKLLLYASNITTTTDNHAHKYQYRQNSAKMQLFPKYWELLVTSHAPTFPWCSAWSTVTRMLMCAWVVAGLYFSYLRKPRLQ